MPRRKRIPLGDATRAIGYVRVSKEEQELGADVQRAALVQWAERQRVTVVTVYEDHVTGGSAIEERPGLTEALRALREHHAGLFLALRRDRLHRDRTTAVAIEKAVEAAGAKILTVDGVANGDRSEDQFLRHMLDAFAQYERATIQYRVKAALARKKDRGEPYSHPPLGYRAEQGKLVPDEQERTMLRAVQQIRNDVHPVRGKPLSLKQVARVANERGFRSRTGGPLSIPTVARMLKRAQELDKIMV